MLADEPAFCRAIVLEVHAAGPIGVSRRRAVLQVFADRYLEVNRQAREQDPDDRAAVGRCRARAGRRDTRAGATRVEEGRTPELAELTEPLAEFVVRNVLATGCEA